MLDAGLPRHIIFKFIQFCILPKLNWGAFIDEDSLDVKKLYEEIDKKIIRMVHNVCIPHVVDAQEFGINFPEV